MSRKEVNEFRIKKFDGTDFGYWRMQIKDYLYGKKLYISLLRKKPKSMSTTD